MHRSFGLLLTIALCLDVFEPIVEPFNWGFCTSCAPCSCNMSHFGTSLIILYFAFKKGGWQGVSLVAKDLFSFKLS